MARSRWRRNLRRGVYLTLDGVAAAAVWTLFFWFRKWSIEAEVTGMQIPIEFDRNFYLGLLLSPPFWWMIHGSTGYYVQADRRSRLSEFSQTLKGVLVGSIILFFLIFLDDVVNDYRQYYRSFMMYAGSLFGVTYILRLSYTSVLRGQVKSGALRFRTLMAGGDAQALALYQKLHDPKRLNGLDWVGFISEHPAPEPMDEVLPRLGQWDQAKRIVLHQDVEEVIIATETTQHMLLQKLITSLSERGVRIRLNPDLYDIVSGTVKFSSLFEAPLIELQAIKMPLWQQWAKRGMDFLLSLVALAFLSPVFFILALAIRWDSKGPVFYSHERIGRYGKPFRIYKFRSMVQDAEKAGPALSSDADQRITKIGKVLRKYRLDELPQFWNVLIGDMSLVGPRPERDYFIRKIEEVAPHYRLLHRVRPGITSWGQVKFGYAENVEEMVERLKFDLLYIENMSLVLDLKILLFTIKTVLRAEGK